MLTQASTVSRSLALRFGLLASVSSVVLFGLLRLPIVEQVVLLPLTRLQGTVAMASAGVSSVPVLVTLSCSGADVIALCLAVTLAYPTSWPRRLAGAGLGVLLILSVNTVRIGTLALAAQGPAFQPLHVYVWPTLLILVTLAYVGLWTWVVDRPAAGTRDLMRHPAVRFGILATLLVALYVAATPWLLGLGALTGIANGLAGAAAHGLGAIGLDASVDGGILRAGRSRFLVTPECVTTPLMPLYLAAAATLPSTWSRRLIGLLAFVPLFAALSTARLLTVALPPLLGASPLFVTHGFYQLLLAGLIVLTIAMARARPTAGAAAAGRLAVGSACLGLAIGLVGGRIAAPLAASLAAALDQLAPHATVAWSAPDDYQGALAILPGFQIGFLVALWVAAQGPRAAWRGLVGSLAILVAFQLALLVALGELDTHAGLRPATMVIRVLALLTPLALVTLATRGRLRAALERNWLEPLTHRLDTRPGHG